MEGAYGETEEYVRAVLTGLSPEYRMGLIQRIRAVLDSELLRSNYDIPDMACPICGCTECIRYGRTRAGTPRWQCKSCHHVSCHIETGSALAFSKLTEAQWMQYAECFVHHISSKYVAERIGVCTKTAWFMRI